MLGTTVPTEMLKLMFVTSSTFSDFMAVAIWLCFSGGGAAPALLVSAVEVPVAAFGSVGDLVSAVLGAGLSFFMSVAPAFWSVPDAAAGDLVSAFLGAVVSFFVSPVFGAIVSDCEAFGLAVAGAFAAAGADLSAGAIFSAGAACVAGELGAGEAPPGLVPCAAASVVPAIRKAAEIKNLFLMVLLRFSPEWKRVSLC